VQGRNSGAKHGVARRGRFARVAVTPPFRQAFGHHTAPAGPLLPSVLARIQDGRGGRPITAKDHADERASDEWPRSPIETRPQLAPDKDHLAAQHDARVGIRKWRPGGIRHRSESGTSGILHRSEMRPLGAASLGVRIAVARRAPLAGRRAPRRHHRHCIRAARGMRDRRPHPFPRVMCARGRPYQTSPPAYACALTYFRRDVKAC
jgi:hypothetical protein